MLFNREFSTSCRVRRRRLMEIAGGYTIYGQEIGILMLDTVFPRLCGDIGNANSFNYPVRYKIVKGAEPERIMGHEPDPRLLEPFIDAARELEFEGVKAITTSCGFLAPFQRSMADSVNVPVFTSTLILAPFVSNMLHSEKRIGIFTERAKYLTERHFLGVGWSPKDIPAVVKGMKENAAFPSVFIGNRPRLDPVLLTREIEEMTDEFIQENQDVGAILLECTNMCPFMKVIHDVSGLPVFGINTLMDFIYNSIVPVDYL
jgi:hypothetical protein